MYHSPCSYNWQWKPWLDSNSIRKWDKSNGLINESILIRLFEQADCYPGGIRRA
jgi:hypothetical protein